METVLAYLPAIACGAMMLLICIPMMRKMHKGQGVTDDSDARQEIDELHGEIARLRAERALEDERETVDG